MARFELDGISELTEAFSRISDLPNSVKEDILNAMGDVTLSAQKEKGEELKVRDPESTVHVLDSIKKTKPKLEGDGGSIQITFAGTRTRGNTTTRNAEIAFINEFGADKKGIKAKEFIRLANESCADKAYQAGADRFHEWLEKDF